MHARHLSEARLRELSVRAACDPRTLLRVIATGVARSPPAQRALAVARAEGLVARDDSPRDADE